MSRSVVPLLFPPHPPAILKERPVASTTAVLHTLEACVTASLMGKEDSFLAREGAGLRENLGSANRYAPPETDTVVSDLATCGFLFL